MAAAAPYVEGPTPPASHRVDLVSSTLPFGILQLLRENLLFILSIFPQDTLSLIYKRFTQASVCPIFEIFLACPSVESKSDIIADRVIVSG